MKINCIIVDDEPIARNILQGFIERDGRLVLNGSYRSASEALQRLQKEKTDLIFLDIQMPEISGLHFLNSLSNAPMVIFTTAFREYAIAGFDLNAIDYLLKPFSFARFLQAVNKSVEFLKSSRIQTHASPASVFIKDGTKIIQVFTDDILYIEAEREYMKIVTEHRTHLIHQSMKALEEKLPADLFVRIHKSYIVSIAKVHAIEANEITIKKTKLPISRQMKEEVLQRITCNKLI